MKPRHIGYATPWVRLLCCLAVACTTWNLFRTEALRVAESAAFSFLLDDDLRSIRTVAFPLQVLILFAACLLPGVLRIERPFLLLLWGSSIAMLHLFAVLQIFMLRNVALPLTVPLAGIIGSTAFLQTLAWSEEREWRRKLERIEVARRQFTDLLVHDLRRRLSSVQVSMNLLESSLPVDAARPKELMTTLKTSADRMLIQVNALLDVRKIEEGRMTLRREPVRVAELFAEADAEYRPAAEVIGIRLQLDACLRSTARLFVDRDIFGRVIANLLWNALQHAPDGTAVDVHIEPRPGGELEVAFLNDGPPVPTEIRDQLFAPFVSGPNRQGTGTGLGLTFCKLAIEVHGGAIRLESPRQGRSDGVLLSVTLPREAVLQA